MRHGREMAMSRRVCETCAWYAAGEYEHGISVVCTLTLNSLDGKWLIGIEDMDAMCGPNLLTHERPDSLGCIASEIEESDVDGCIDWADRIRRLADREDKR